MIVDDDSACENNLWNPYSKITCLILYLYSLEFQAGGSAHAPPLYVEVNRVCRTMDATWIEELGPFVRALGQVTTGHGEFHKED